MSDAAYIFVCQVYEAVVFSTCSGQYVFVVFPCRLHYYIVARSLMQVRQFKTEEILSLIISHTHVYMYVWLCTIIGHEEQMINGKSVKVLKFEVKQIKAKRTR